MTTEITGTLNTRTGKVTFIRARIATFPMVTALTMLQDLHHRSLNRASTVLRGVGILKVPQARAAYRTTLLSMVGQIAVLSAQDRLSIFTRTLSFARSAGGHIAGLESLVVSGISAAIAAGRNDLVVEGISLIASFGGKEKMGDFAGGRGLTPFWNPLAGAFGFFDQQGFVGLPGAFGGLGAPLGLTGILSGGTGGTSGPSFAPGAGPNVQADSTGMCVAGWGYIGAALGTVGGEAAFGPAGGAVGGAEGAIGGAMVGELACRPEFSVAATPEDVTDPMSGMNLGPGASSDGETTEETDSEKDPLTGSVGDTGMADPSNPENDEGPSFTLGKKSYVTPTYPRGPGLSGLTTSGGPRVFIANDMPQLGTGADHIAKQGAFNQIQFTSRVNPSPETGGSSPLPFPTRHDLHLGGSGPGNGPIVLDPTTLHTQFGRRAGKQLENFLRQIARTP